MPKAACDRAKTKPKVKKTASFQAESATLQDLWKCYNPEIFRRSVPLPKHKIKMVAAIGPATGSPVMLARHICAGLNMVRLACSRGDVIGYSGRIARLRAAAKTDSLSKRIAFNAGNVYTGCRHSILPAPAPGRQAGK